MPLFLEHIDLRHQERFLLSVKRSQELHRPWTSPPNTAESFQRYVEKYRSEHHFSFVVLNNSSDLIGCINLNDLIRGSLQSAFLGCYVFVPFNGQGLMKQSMSMVISEAFGVVGLHRLEANIQPGNATSIHLVATLGFRHEGYSPKYLKMNGEWRDHGRYAITAEEWAS